MTSTEAMIFQLKNLKGKPLKQKLEHIFTYYWIPIMVIVVILGVAVSYIVHLATMKDSGLTVTCINAYAERDQVEAYITEFAQQAKIDLDQYEVRLSTDMTILNDDLMNSYDTIQTLTAQIAGQTIDMIVSDPQTLSLYIYQDIFVDLTQVLDPEQQTEYEQHYLYMDIAFFKKIETLPEGSIEYPDPTKPELMEQPVPVALLLPENGEFQQLCYPHKPDEVAVGILFNSQNIDNAQAFLDYIMK